MEQERVPYVFGWPRWMHILLLFLLVMMQVQRAWPAPLDSFTQLTYLSDRWAFDFAGWEAGALWQKMLFGLAAPQRWMDERTQAQFVLDYFAEVGVVRSLTADILETFSDPNETDPLATTRAQRAELALRRAALRRQGRVAEAIIGEQVAQVMADAGLGVGGQMLPPVSGMFTPLPYMLVISPRDHIESVYQRALKTDMTVADQDALEKEVERVLPEYSAFITDIGGLAAYPAMLYESTSLEWGVSVMAHEWVHHTLLPTPVSLQYLESPDARSINETAASLMDRWAGQEIVQRFYAPLLQRTKNLPQPLIAPPAPSDADAPAPDPPAFDFRAEMHTTRLEVERLLATGAITEAEQYMDARREVFVAHGYVLRRLNQAYFAFYGAYADQPGASGEDPIGPAVRRLWAISATPRDFLRSIGPLTSLQALEATLAAQLEMH